MYQFKSITVHSVQSAYQQHIKLQNLTKSLKYSLNRSPRLELSSRRKCWRNWSRQVAWSFPTPSVAQRSLCLGTTTPTRTTSAPAIINHSLSSSFLIHICSRITSFLSRVRTNATCDIDTSN